MATGEHSSTYSGEGRSLQLALAAAAVGALLILLSLFGVLFSVIGLILIVLGTVAAAPAARGAGWWRMLAIGASISVVAALVQLANDTLGGLIAVVGGILVLIGVALGYPLKNE